MLSVHMVAYKWLGLVWREVGGGRGGGLVYHLEYAGRASVISVPRTKAWINSGQATLTCQTPSDIHLQKVACVTWSILVLLPKSLQRSVLPTTNYTGMSITYQHPGVTSLTYPLPLQYTPRMINLGPIYPRGYTEPSFNIPPPVSKYPQGHTEPRLNIPPVCWI